MPAARTTRAEATAAEASFEDRMHEASLEHRPLIAANLTRLVEPMNELGRVIVRVTANIDPYLLAMYGVVLSLYRGQGGARARLAKKRARMAIRKIRKRQQTETQPSYRGHR